MNSNIEVSFSDNYFLIHEFLICSVEAGWENELQHHKIFELLYCVDGDVKQKVNNQMIHLKTGDCILIKPGTRHRTINNSSKPFTFFVFHFDISNPELRKYLNSSAIKTYLPKNHSTNSFLANYINKATEIVNTQSTIGLNNKGNLNRDIINLAFKEVVSFQAFVLLIIYEFINVQENKQEEDVIEEQGVSQHEMGLANQIATILDSHLYDSIMIQDISKELNISRSQCFQVFNKVYGISPRKYLSNLKLNKAKELLIQTDLTIEEISNDLGFTSIYSFSRQFRRWTGSSPNKFRLKPNKIT